MGSQAKLVLLIVPLLGFAALAFMVFIIAAGSESIAKPAPPSAATGGDLAACGLTAEQISALLSEKYKSTGYNLAPHANQIHNADCTLFHVNPLLSLAMMQHESGFGTAGAGEACKNPGNIGWRDDRYKDAQVTGVTECRRKRLWPGFQSYGDGAQAQAWLLRTNYLNKEEELTELGRTYRQTGTTKNCESHGKDPSFGTIDPRVSDLLLGMILRYAPYCDGNNPIGYTKHIVDFMSANAPGAS